MIVFENSGEIDPRLIQLIGTNVKVTDNPVGFFGTGLKYTIASICRWNDSIIIQSGEAEFNFRSETTTIREKEFSLVRMNGPLDSILMSFTTDLGKNWKPWMIYRELYCNAMDEPGGKVYLSESPPPRRPGITRVIVDSQKLFDAYLLQDKFILNTTNRVPLADSKEVQIFAGSSDTVFYRKIAVQVTDKPWLFTYNITSSISLTEDRTAHGWEVNFNISRAIMNLQDKDLVQKMLLASTDCMEAGLDYSRFLVPHSSWEEVAQSLVETQPLNVPNSVRSRYTPTSTEKRCVACGQILPQNDSIPF